MLNKADIQILYLKLLRRLPTDQEIAEATDLLEDSLKNTNEYKNLHNLPMFDSSFNNSNNTFTISNINDYKYGCLLTNGSIGINTSSSHNIATKVFMKYDHIEYTIPDFTNINILHNNSNMNISNHSQTLDMNNCKFVDRFTLNSDIDISIEKFPLHNHSSCFLQKVTVTSAQNYNLSFHHLFDRKDESNSFMLSSMHFSFIRDTTIMMTNMYAFQQPDFIFKGFQSYNNQFDISIRADIPFVFYIITTASFSKQNNIDNLLLHSQLYSFDEIIQHHTKKWNNTWSQINITNKSNTNQNDKNIDKINFTIVNALFNVFSDIYTTDHLYHLPILILLRPKLAKYVLDFIIKNDKPDSIITNDGFVLYKKALLSIHTWNIFRVTKDKNWLQNTGFPLMQNNIKLLFDVFHDDNKSFRNVYALNKFKQTNNTLTNYLISLAIEYTIQALYELNYAPISSYSTFLNHIKNIKVFNHTSLITLNDTNVHIKLGSNNNLYHYDFYDSSNNYIGYNFGGSSGYKLSLLPNTDYNFSVDESTFDFPILFTAINNSNEILNYNQNEFLLQSVFTDNSSNLKGYSLFTSNTHSIFKEHFNHNVGENAFISQSINDIIIPYSNYSFEALQFVEPYVIFNSYYNDNLLANHNKTSLSHIIKDNLTFYASSSNNTFNKLFEGGLLGFVSQYESKYINKRTCINLFYNKILSVLDISEPWNNTNNDIGLILIFVIITCIFELEPRGKTNQNRFMIEQYGLGYTNRNVLPDPWKQISILNTGIENHTCFVNNILYTDHPFDSLIEGTRFTPILNELDNTITLHTNIEDIFPTSNNLQYSFLLQNIDDLNEYNMNQIKTHPLRVDKSNFVVDDFIPLQSNQSDPYIVPEFYERIVNVYSSNNGVEKHFSKTIPTLTDTTSTDLINPTIYATISFESSNQMYVDMKFNSFDRVLYNTFSNLDINIFYNPTIVTSNVSFVSSETHTFNNYHSNLNITITTDSPVASANYNIGTLSFELNPNIMFNMIADMQFPFYGTVYSFKQKNIYITNPEVFPPTVFKVFQPSTDFVSKLFSLESNVYVKSNPIQNISILQNDHLEPYDIDDILTPDTYLYNVRDCLDHSFFTLCNTTTSSLEYFAIGNNSNNMLMMTSLANQSELPTLTRCEQFEQFLTNNNLTNYKLFTTNTFNLLLTDTNTVYGIGYNESYNLGIDDSVSWSAFKTLIMNSQGIYGDPVNDNIYTFELSTNINRLIEQQLENGSNLSHICLNNTATLLCFNSNILYGLGEMDLFSYCDVTTDDGSSNLLKNPKLLPKINNFFNSNQHYLIKNIESGSEHFKFRLYNNNTSQDEWWGIGKNSYNSIGINPFVETDFDVKYMKRLHLIEQLIHGQKYNDNYTGNTVTNNKLYHFISGNGSPNAFTAIMDTITYDTYYIGVSSNNSNIHNWTKINAFDMSSNIPNFAITFNNNIMLGH